MTGAYIAVSISPSGPAGRTPVVTQHSIDALEYYHYLKGTPAGKLINPYRSRKHMPLAGLITMLFLFAFGPSPTAIFISLACFLSLLLWSVLRLGSLLKDERAGLLAAVLTLAPLCFWEMEHHWFPYAFLKEYFPELLLMVLVTSAMNLMIRSNYLESKKYTLCLGLVCGLGLLTKWTFPIYIAPAAAFMFWKNRRHPRRRRNAYLALALCGLIFIPWYFLMIYFNPGGIISYFAGELSVKRAINLAFPHPLSLESLLFYPWLLSQLITVPIFVIFLFSLISFARRRVSPPITVAIIASYIILTLLPGKFVRPLIPILPLCGVVVGTQCGEIKSGWWRRALAGLIILICIWAFAAHYFLLPRAWPLSRLLHPPPGLVQTGDGSTIKRILRDIKKLKKSRSIATVCVVPYQRDFRVDSFIFWARCEGYTFDFWPSHYIREDEWEHGFDDADFVITRKGEVGPGWAVPRRDEISHYLEDESGEFSQTFKLIKSYPLNGTGGAGLYGRRSPERGFEIYPPGERDETGEALAVFSDHFALKEFGSEALPDQRLRLRYEWECLKEVSRSYRIVVHFEKERELIFTQDHTPAHEKYPTQLWRKGESIAEEYTKEIPPGASEGIYQIWVGVWDGIFYMKISDTALEQKKDKLVKVGEIRLKPGKIKPVPSGG